MKKSILISMALATPLCVGHASATVLNFDNPPVPFQVGYGVNDVYTESGYSLRTIGGTGAIIRFNPFVQNALVPNNGTVHFGVTYDANPVLTREPRHLFDFQSLDLAEYSEFVPAPLVTLAGITATGETLIRSITLDGIFDGLGGSNDFQHVELAWRKLTRVEFRASGFAFDNLEVRAVPEPTTAGLVAAGLLAFAIRRSSAKSDQKVNSIENP